MRVLQRPCDTWMDSAANPKAPLSGLTSAEAAARLRAEGANELPTAAPRNLRAIALHTVREPMFMLLIAACAIYLMLGDKLEALVLLLSISVIIAIAIIQERKSERALEALRELASPRALVIRDGQRVRIAGREVVRGDLLVLEEGDRVAADGVLWRANDLHIDESLLTGESVRVRKVVWDGSRQMTHPGGDDLPFAYAGTLVTQGQGVAEIVGTGAHTEMGRIGKSLATLADETTPLQIETRRVVRTFAIAGLSLCVVVAVLYGALRAGWLQGVLAGVTLAMATLPEEFPVVLTVFLALGAWRMSRHRVLTRRASAIEALGAATVLCVDKTGTLTLNRMSLRQLWTAPSAAPVDLKPEEPLSAAHRELLNVAILASEDQPFDAMERAFHEAGERLLAQRSHDGAGTLAREYPLTPELLVHAHGWQRADGVRLLAAKGAPEAVVRACALAPEESARVTQIANEMASSGLRVLAVAHAQPRDWPTRLEPRPASGPESMPFTFLGLAGLADPVRPTVTAAIAQAREAGIRVVMITGDYPVTAQAIAREIGLAGAEQACSGAQMEQLSGAALREQVARTNVFARVMPQQKLRLVQALKANGEVVAMTGDGVNDAPALRAAHIGIAMGGRGTDVAREAASLVLLDDDFDSIVRAVRMGRRIYDNIRAAATYLLAVHIPTAGLALLAVVVGWPLILLPVHVVFLEFVIDPACSIAFEAEPEQVNLMRRPPRPPQARLFSRATVTLAVLQGLSVLVAAAIMFALQLRAGADENSARAAAFVSLALGNIALILTNRSRGESLTTMLRTPNPALWWIVLGTLLGLAAATLLPALRELFRFHPLTLATWGWCALAVVVSLSWTEIYKLWLLLDLHQHAPSANR
jgi:P-type Ca2+ transporter type 2C